MDPEQSNEHPEEQASELVDVAAENPPDPAGNTEQTTENAEETADDGQSAQADETAAETEVQNAEGDGQTAEGEISQLEQDETKSVDGYGEEEQETSAEQQDQTQVQDEEVPVQDDEEADIQEEQTAGHAQQAEEDVEVGRQRDAEPGEEEEEEEESPVLQDKATPEPATETVTMGTETVAMEAEQTEESPAQPVAAHVSSPVSPYDRDATATVKFVLLPQQQVATLRCYLAQTMADLKQHFSTELKIPDSVIQLLLNGKLLEDGSAVGDLGVGANGTIRLEMQSADPETMPIRAFKPRQEYTMPDVITVRVETDEGQLTDVVVEIERAVRKKPFLGGYRHKNTGVEYHHASAQTMPKPRPPPSTERFCRDTQTVQQKHRVQQTTNPTSTQMTKIGVYVGNMEDKLVIPGAYTTADDFRANILNKVVTLQKYYRRWLAKRYVEKVRNDKQARQDWEVEEEQRKKKEKEDRIRKEFERRMNPKTKEDFDLLYHALEKWRQEEMDRIDETLTGAERKAALCQLLDQETQLLASIGRHQLEASSENKNKGINQFLEKASSPKKWRGPDGKTTEMDTPFTIRARELRDIYNSITMKYLTQDERLDVLLTLKHTVKEHDCKLTQEIIELIDREADLLMRGVKESNLDGLRKRISTLFLQYIKTPTFNPEAARLLKVPQDPSTLRKNIYYCPSCSQYLPSTEFQLYSNSRTVGKCRRCSSTDNDARSRQDYAHYRFMLKDIRSTEQGYNDESKIAFLMQEGDLRYLVENVWNSQSVLSAWDDLYDLVLVRWDRYDQWSPWNSILLTKDEAAAHAKLKHLDEAYGKVFIHKVKHKHTLARNYFSRLPGMAEHMRPPGSGTHLSGSAVSGKPVPVAVK